MRTLAVAAVVLVGLGGLVAGEIKSGPQVGDTLPGAFEPLNLNGPDAGDENCLFCKYGNSPVVMVFAAKPSDGLTKLVRKLEKKAGEVGQDQEMGACVIVTDTSPAVTAELRKLADRENLKHVILAVIDPAKLKAYALSAEADATVLVYSKKVVRANHALKTAELTDAAGDKVMSDLEKAVTAK
jgi:hypothetical protein